MHWSLHFDSLLCVCAFVFFPLALALALAHSFLSLDALATKHKNAPDDSKSAGLHAASPASRLRLPMTIALLMFELSPSWPLSARKSNGNAEPLGATNSQNLTLETRNY